MYVAKRKFVIKYGNEGHYVSRLDAPWYRKPYVVYKPEKFITRTHTRLGAERYINKIESLRGW